MQEAVEKLMQLGPIPSYAESTVEILDQYSQLIDAVVKPVSDEDALVLLKLFSPDDPGGINWGIIHLVETAPNWPQPLKLLIESLGDVQPQSDAVELLVVRAKNGGLWS